MNRQKRSCRPLLKEIAVATALRPSLPRLAPEDGSRSELSGNTINLTIAETRFASVAEQEMPRPLIDCCLALESVQLATTPLNLDKRSIAFSEDSRRARGTWL